MISLEGYEIVLCMYASCLLNWQLTMCPVQTRYITLIVPPDTVLAFFPWEYYFVPTVPLQMNVVCMFMLTVPCG